MQSTIRHEQATVTLKKQLRAAIPSSLYDASDSVGWRATLLHFGVVFLLLASAAPLWRSISPWASGILILPLGVAIYKLTIVLHDCGHYTLFRTRRLNRGVGQVTGWMLATDFDQFSRTHWLHHRIYGSSGDPQGHDYLGLQSASRTRLLWHLARPLLGYNVFKLAQIQAASPRVDAASITKADRRHLLRLPGGTLAAQFLVAAVATGFGQVLWLVFLYPISSATVALFLSQIRGFCEHVPPAGSVPEAFARTHLPNRLDRLLFYGLNFNYHVEHHLIPTVPFHHLPAVHREIGYRIHMPETVSRSILDTIRQRFSQCEA